MLTLTHIRLGLHDLLDKRRADLRRSKAGKYYEAMLEEQLEAVDGLPPVLTGGVPLAAEIDVLDDEHDGYGGAIYFTTEVYLRLPDADPETVEAANRIRAAFIPSLSELGATYAVEAERARDRKPLLKSMKADLQRFPLADERTLLDVATLFLDAGERIHQKLSERADVPKGTRKQAAHIRSTTVGILGRFRTDLAREVKKDPSLPQDLEQKVFGYFDTLESMRATPAGKGDVVPASPEASPDKDLKPGP